MILTEYGLHFAEEGKHWRCVEYPYLLMLRGPEGYPVGERTFASLDEALRHRKASEGTSPTPVSKASGRRSSLREPAMLSSPIIQ
jgi:hypothetical protein